ncbi:hypothetical protein FA13DRAFT_1009473 [Coprinellus micaceus]|uniref:NACHT domain-containing protein n=1 Tax=Coprinellus micaceus TaxID=71717 RepID=A0A4Y7SXZ2_COPMI|nr:hypothetical protein FA13DRAFT_1009473 [Coprinellus micaceus]
MANFTGDELAETRSTEYFTNAHHCQFGEVHIHHESNVQGVNRGSDKLGLNPIPGASHTRNRKTSPPNSDCLPGTRRDVIQEIITWAMSSLYFGVRLLPYVGPLLPSFLSFLAPPYEAQHILWVFGYAGCGKSAIAQAIATRLEEEGCLGASFFFFRGSGDRSKLAGLAQTIASQVATSIKGTAGYIRAALAAHPDLFQPTTSPKTQFKHLVYDPISAAARAWYNPAGIWRPFIIVIDGLDECDDKEEGSAWLEDLIEVFDRNPFIPLRFIILSRVEDHIHRRLHKSSQVRLFNLVDRTSEQDISTALDITIANETKISRVLASFEGTWLTPRDKQRLLENIGGSFIFLTTIARFLFGPSSIDGRTPPERLPLALNMNPGFDGAYKAILEGARHFSHSLDIIHTVGLMLRPLSVVEIASLLNINVGAVVHVLVEIHAIIQVPDDDHTPITLWHTSLRDFLNDETRSGPFCASSEHQERIALGCIELAMPTAPTGVNPASQYAKDHVWDHSRAALNAVDKASRRKVAEALFVRMREGDGFLERAPPDILDTLYISVLTRSQRMPHFLDVITSFALAVEPISATQIADLLEIERADITGALVSMQPLFRVEGNWDFTPILPCYPSLRDFLKGPSGVPLKGHKRLAARCVNLAIPFDPPNMHPAAPYARQYAWDHYRAALGACDTIDEERNIHIEILTRLRDKDAFLAVARKDIVKDLYRSIFGGLKDTAPLAIIIAIRIVLAKRPVCIAEIATGLGIETAVVTDAAKALHGLIQLPERDYLPFAPCHRSLRRFVQMEYCPFENKDIGLISLASLEDCPDITALVEPSHMSRVVPAPCGPVLHIYMGAYRTRSQGRVKVAIKIIREGGLNPAQIAKVQRDAMRESKLWNGFPVVREWNCAPVCAEVPRYSEDPTCQRRCEWPSVYSWSELCARRNKIRERSYV